MCLEENENPEGVLWLYELYHPFGIGRMIREYEIASGDEQERPRNDG
jgi:hypothetical protein